MKTLQAITAALCLSASAAFAQNFAVGKELYDDHCAACHGADADGRGPLAPALLLQPADLRSLAARNDGVFPVARIVSRIDGRDPLVSHGSPMPVYGPYFEGVDSTLKAETGQPIMTSRAIVDLITYLEVIQE